MRASLAFLAGVATVVVAIAAGLGGGFLLSGVIANPQESEQASKQAEATHLDQRAPIPAINGAAQSVPFMATPSGGTVAGPQAPKQAGPQPSQQAQPLSQQGATQPAEPKQSPERTAPAQSAATTSEPPAAPEDSFAKARDDEPKRDARSAEGERRKAERRQQRAEQRAERRKARQRWRDDSDRFDTGMQDTTQSWPPYYRQPAYGTGRMTLFGDD